MLEFSLMFKAAKLQNNSSRANITQRKETEKNVFKRLSISKTACHKSSKKS